ncbi:MAG TPA: hypothetical protein VN848_01265 [Gemmatimonadales bacterium]|nr:hypothetical protein [Gemmatimonadales bacterium]
MRVLGPIVRLQIQRWPLKTGTRGDRVYNPAPILAVDRLAVAPDGVFGLDPAQGWIVDVHHRAHPDTRNADGRHALSLGFTGHYAAIEEHFSRSVPLGCAGENIIVDAAGRFMLEDLAPGVAVLAPDGTERLRLEVPAVAHPCRPFTGWLSGGISEAEVLKEKLQFLDDGMRGFRLAGEAAGFVAVGDRVAVLETQSAAGAAPG